MLDGLAPVLGVEVNQPVPQVLDRLQGEGRHLGGNTYIINTFGATKIYQFRFMSLLLEWETLSSFNTTSTQEE